MAKIVIIDDEWSILESLDMFLSEKGHSVYKASNALDGHRLFVDTNPEVVFLDIRLPDQSGLELLLALKEKRTSARIIMMTAFHDMETTIEAMKRGAYDYIHKPLDANEVESSLKRALHLAMVEQQTPIMDDASRPPRPGVIIGKSKGMREIFKMIGLLSQNSATVLIQGETGTGKELIARVIHRNSLYSAEPLITVDCGAVVENLLESELFGHEAGSFTGATHLKKGKVELAGRGTLFLDEISELSLGLQAKFLGFLQRREFMRVGGQELLKSSCRVIAATNKELGELVRKGRFREDLYFRLKVVTIRVPPLRERVSDIPDLVNHFIQKINMEMGTRVTKLEPGVMERLLSHEWNGNVRELENVLVEAMLKSNSSVLLLDDILEVLSKNSTCNSSHKSEEDLFSYALGRMEKEHIRSALEHVRWNRTQAARLLGISVPTLRAKIRRYGLEPHE